MNEKLNLIWLILSITFGVLYGILFGAILAMLHDLI